MTLADKYKLHDLLLTELARFYSEQYDEPFFVAVGDNAAYDMISASREITIEVKTEATPTRTGNVAIEYWNPDLGKASGVLATEANLWVHIIPEGGMPMAYEYEINALRKLVIEDGIVKTNGRNALFKLIPLPLFRKHAKRTYPFHSIFKEAIWTN